MYSVFALAPTLQDKVYLRIGKVELVCYPWRKTPLTRSSRVGMVSSLITVVVAIQPTL